MPILKQSDKTYTPVPAGSHPARCYAMISLGTQPSKNPKYKPNFQILLMFEFPTEIVEINGEQRPMTNSAFLNAYLGPNSKPSNTHKFIVAWRGRPFTEDELNGFDVAKVVGAPCLINIIHETKDGVTRDKIASISPLPKGMVCPAQFHKSVVYEIEQGKDATYQALPEWIQEKIAACLEWTRPAIRNEAPPQASEASAGSPAPEEDDVPF